MKQPNPAEKSDEQGLTGLKQTLTVLDSIQNKPYLTGSVVQLGYLFVARDCDMPLIIANTRGMAHLYHDGVQESTQGEALCAVVNGAIDQWLDACRRACIREADSVLRYTFNRVYRDIQKRVPVSLLDGLSTADNGDQTFRLEYHA